MPDNKTVSFDATLKPCPFCGSHNIKVVDLAGWEVWCDDCGATCNATDPITGCAWDSSDKAVAAWNTRAPTPAAQGAGQEAGLPSWWPAFIQNVCELPDRTSPEDEPEAMVATAEELESCAMAAIEAASEDESPATDTDEAGALRAFDRAKQKGHSHDLESYCAGYIDRGYAAPVQSAGQEAVAWRPVETAPKDGTWFLAWRKHETKPLMLRWDAAYAEFENADGDHVYHVTHWMPLPRDPNAAPVNGGERELGQVIDERDQYHDAAEKLADAIAKHFGVEIGEHSNLNCPWQNALDHIAQATKRTADAQQVGQMSDRQIIELCKSVGVEWEGPDMCDFMGDFGRVNMAGMRAIINAAKEQK